MTITLDKVLLNHLLLIKMKNLGKTLLPLLLLLLTALPVLAVGEAKVNTVRQTAQEESMMGENNGISQTIRQEAQEEVRSGLKEKAANLAGRIDVRKQEIIRNHFGFIARRFQAAINRLGKIVIRIESRITKIEEDDSKINLTAIKKELVGIKESLNESSQQIEAIQAEAEKALTDDNTKQAFEEIREKTNEIKEELIENRQALSKIIGGIKGLGLGPKTAEPTEENQEAE